MPNDPQPPYSAAELRLRADTATRRARVARKEAFELERVAQDARREAAQLEKTEKDMNGPRPGRGV